MTRKLLAFFSPLKPTRSGVADYSEKLLPRLAKTFDIHLYGNDDPPSSPLIKSHFSWFPRRNYEIQKRKTPYDLNVYQIGNSRYHQFIYPVMAQYPGAVILHDANVHHARAYAHLGHRNLVDYLDEVEWCHGSAGAQIGPAIAHGYHSPVLYDRFPMLRIVCEGAKSVLVHNRFSAERVLEHTEPRRVFQLSLPYSDLNLPDYHKTRQLLGISEEERIVASFGFVTPEKGIDSALSAFEVFQRENPSSRFVLVGSALEGEFERWLRRRLAGIPNTELTGYLEDTDFKNWLAACDICIALRYPTQGESSDAVLRIMGAGKPVIVPQYRQFMKIPTDACIQVPIWPNEAYAVLIALRELIANPDLASGISQRARRYVLNNHSEQNWVDSISSALERTLELPTIKPLSRQCSLRHVRVAPVEESIAQSLYSWGDIAQHEGVIQPLVTALKELGLHEKN